MRRISVQRVIRIAQGSAVFILVFGALAYMVLPERGPLPKATAILSGKPFAAT
jgi:hypothetical protein